PRDDSRDVGVFAVRGLRGVRFVVPPLLPSLLLVALSVLSILFLLALCGGRRHVLWPPAGELKGPLRGPLASGVDKGPEALCAPSIAQPPEGFCFDLSNALARDREPLTNLFERVLAPVADPEPHPQDARFARR